MKRAALVLLAMLMLAAGLVQWRAPQIFVLLSEGFPGPVWPASGQFAPVAGNPDATDPPLAPAPPAPALTRLAESNGRALLMFQAGVLRFETYGDGIGRDTLLNSYSMVKSLVGALVLWAVADGRIAGLDTPLRDILGPDAPDITIGAALSMTAGLAMAPKVRGQGSDGWHIRHDVLDRAGQGIAGPFAYMTGLKGQMWLGPVRRAGAVAAFHDL